MILRDESYVIRAKMTESSIQSLWLSLASSTPYLNIVLPKPESTTPV